MPSRALAGSVKSDDGSTGSALETTGSVEGFGTEGAEATTGYTEGLGASARGTVDCPRRRLSNDTPSSYDRIASLSCRNTTARREPIQNQNHSVRSTTERFSALCVHEALPSSW